MCGRECKQGSAFHRLNQSLSLLASFNRYTPNSRNPGIDNDCYTKIHKALSAGEKVVKLPSRVNPDLNCGDGVLALVPLEKGTVATYYGGLLISEKQAKALPLERQSHCRRFVKGLVLDGSSHFRTGPHQGLGSAINESDEPNCHYRESHSPPTRIEVFTLRDIQQGEELTVSYGRNYDDGNLKGRSRVGRPRKKRRTGFQEKLTMALKRPRVSPVRFRY